MMKRSQKPITLLKGPEEDKFKILVNGFDDPLTTLKLPGPQ